MSKKSFQDIINERYGKQGIHIPEPKGGNLKTVNDRYTDSAGAAVIIIMLLGVSGWVIRMLLWILIGNSVRNTKKEKINALIHTLMIISMFLGFGGLIFMFVNFYPSSPVLLVTSNDKVIMLSLISLMFLIPIFIKEYHDDLEGMLQDSYNDISGIRIYNFSDLRNIEYSIPTTFLICALCILADRRYPFSILAEIYNSIGFEFLILFFSIAVISIPFFIFKYYLEYIKDIFSGTTDILTDRDIKNNTKTSTILKIVRVGLLVIFSIFILLNVPTKKYYMNKGRSYLNGGNYKKAVLAFNMAIELDPQQDKAYRGRGVAYGNDGRHDFAIEDFSMAIKLNPKDALNYDNRGAAYARKELYDKAKEDLKIAIELDPKNANAYYNLGEVNKCKGLYKEAINNYIKAKEIDPNINSNLNNAMEYCEKRLPKIHKDNEIRNIIKKIF